MTSRLDSAPTGSASTEGSDPQLPKDFGTDRFLNRELSWLDFASRLLDLAEDETIPLLGRVKFLAIFSSGLDEFFQVRVAGLKDQAAAKVRARSPDGRSADEQLAEIHDGVVRLVERQSRIFAHHLQPALASNGIEIVDIDSLDPRSRAELDTTFERDIFPVLTPLAVDPGHPFPYISNLSLSLAVLVEDARTRESRFARVKVPPLLPRFVPVSDGNRFVPLEQLIAANLEALFPEMLMGPTYAFRVTRNADFELEDEEADDLLEAVEVELRRRRFGRTVRLEIDPTTSPEVLDLLLRELEIGPGDVYTPRAPLDLAQLWSIAGMNRPELAEPAWIPTNPPAIAGAPGEPVDIFAVLRERDILVHHPYESFATSVEEFIRQAAADPDVLAIKQTLYRTSGDAPFVAALARAADAGKQVAALVELKARFDEQRNIVWARQLEEAGVHVVYGLAGLKVHSKTALVVRREGDGIRRYCHIGTGNYNSDTAKIYEDIGLLSADSELGADLTDLFNHLTGFSRTATTRLLILAPDRLRPWVLAEIAKQAERGPGGRITIKVNGLTDPEIIDALYVASQAGVAIDLVVRGVCSLRPGVAGLSETITVRSIVGRFLEHSRIYRFGTPDAAVQEHCVVSPLHKAVDDEPATYFIGSADLMGRNLGGRVEALVPVRDPELCARLEDILTLDLLDDRQAWYLDEDGIWQRIANREGVSAQGRLAELALDRAGRRRARDTSA